MSDTRRRSRRAGQIPLSEGSCLASESGIPDA